MPLSRIVLVLAFLRLNKWKQMKTYCDGVIVGSAIVKMIEQEQKSSVATVGTFVKSLRNALMIFHNKKSSTCCSFYLDIAVGTNTTDRFPNSSQRFVTKFYDILQYHCCCMDH